MNGENSTYNPKTSRIVFERFGEEIVVVNLKSGLYYSLNPTASVIWDCLVHGMRPGSIASRMAQSHGRDPEPLKQTVLDFVHRLAAEELITQDTGSAQGGEPSPPDFVATSDSPYASPSFERFSDMQEMLLLDPIHEVDESGWPSKIGHPDQDSGS